MREMEADHLERIKEEKIQKAIKGNTEFKDGVLVKREYAEKELKKRREAASSAQSNCFDEIMNLTGRRSRNSMDNS